MIDDAIQELSDPDDDLVEQIIEDRLIASEDAVSLNEVTEEVVNEAEAHVGFIVPVDIPTGESFQHVDQVKQMYDSTKNKNLNILWKNAYSLICGLAMESVSTNHSRMDSSELYLLIFEQCELAFQNLHLKDYANEIIFSFLPDGIDASKWPKEFVDWWEAKKRVPVPAGFLQRELKRYKNASVDTQQMAFFGMKAKEQFVADRSFIRSHLCPKWMPAHLLPSGTTVHGLLHGIRMSCISLFADKKAKDAIKNDMKKLLPAEREAARDVLYEKRYNEARKKLVDGSDWFYPDCWLLYIFCSQPSKKPLLNFMPSSHLTTKTFQHGTTAASPGGAFRNMLGLGRDRRRHLDKNSVDLTSSDTVEPPKKKANASSSSEPGLMTLVHQIGAPKLTPIEELEALIETKQLELSLLQMINSDQAEVHSLVQEILALVREKATMHEDNRKVETD